MSALRGFEVANSMSEGTGIEVPRSFQPDADTVLIASTARYIEYPASARSFGSNSTSQIIIPQHQSRYLLGGTTFLNFRVTVSATATFAREVAAGAGRYNAASYFTGGPTKSAAALVDRITVAAANGQVLADIPNYAQWHNLVLLHMANENYRSTASISENAFTCIANGTTLCSTFATNTNTTLEASGSVDIQLPLALGLFNEVKAFPLWALNGPLIITIQWASAERSIGITEMIYVPDLSIGIDKSNHIYWGNQSGPAMSVPVVSYSGSDLSLRVKCVDVDIDYINQQRQQMMQGKFLTFNYKQVQNLVMTAGGASLSFGVNCSSLLSVFGVTQLNTQQSVISPSVKGIGSLQSGTWGFTSNNMQNIRVFSDGMQLTTFPLLQDGKDDAFVPLQEAVGTLFSTTTGTMCRKYCGAGMGTTGSGIAIEVPTAHDNYRLCQGYFLQSGGATHFPIPPVWQYDQGYGPGSIYAPNGYAWGVSARMCNDTEIANKGTRCSQLQITIDSAASNSGSHYLYYLYSCSVSFDGAGNVIVRR